MRNASVWTDQDYPAREDGAVLPPTHPGVRRATARRAELDKLLLVAMSCVALLGLLASA